MPDAEEIHDAIQPALNEHDIPEPDEIEHEDTGHRLTWYGTNDHDGAHAFITDSAIEMDGVQTHASVMIQRVAEALHEQNQ